MNRYQERPARDAIVFDTSFGPIEYEPIKIDSVTDIDYEGAVVREIRQEIEKENT